MDKIIVIGGGGHAKIIINLLQKLKKYSILGYVDRADKGDILGVGYLGNDDGLSHIKSQNPRCHAVIGVGQVDIKNNRREIHQRLVRLGFDLPTLISPDAIVASDVKLGQGSVVIEGAIIQPGTVIGHCAIINTGVCIDHDCRLGDFVHMAPGTVLSGGVEVGDDVMICTGAVVIQCRKICSQCLIGAGATVVDDLTQPGKYLGTPARIGLHEKILA